MRIEPNAKYQGMPCSYAGTGCAYENIWGEPFRYPVPENLRDDGYLSLDSANKFIRAHLMVRKKVYFGYPTLNTPKNLPNIYTNSFRNPPTTSA